MSDKAHSSSDHPVAGLGTTRTSSLTVFLEWHELLSRHDSDLAYAGGTAKAGPASVWWAAAGGLAHVASGTAAAHGGLQGLLTRNHLLDPPEGTLPLSVIRHALSCNHLTVYRVSSAACHWLRLKASRSMLAGKCVLTCVLMLLLAWSASA